MADDLTGGSGSAPSLVRLIEAGAEDRSFLERLQAELTGEIKRVRAGAEAALQDLRRDQTAALATLRIPDEGDVPEGVEPTETELYRRLRASPLMDARWYCVTYPDVPALGVDPILHYLRFGWREARRPGPVFDGEAYLDANPDVRRAGVNPLVHYIDSGAAESRPLRPLDSIEASGPPPAAIDPASAGRCWFFLGDTLNWMRDHTSFSGVGRVTCELFFELLQSEDRVRPCIVGEGPAGLVRLDEPTVLFDLAHRCGRQAGDLPPPADLDEPYPRRGDHIFFTGVVWTDTYVAVFERLKAEGLTFSVLVHDIIPLHSGGNLDRAAEFARWFSVVMAEAAAVYVSSAVVAEDVSRWAVAAGVPSRASLKLIPFGHRSSPPAAISPEWAAGLSADAFVLSVGTIDVRKNQRQLVAFWVELLRRRGPNGIPQLVLAGRDDLGLGEDPAFRELCEGGKALILSGLSDAQVAALYRACLFTVFPSTREGFGLPVAESLAYGKPCLTTDLPAIRAHAGDLVWYFDPSDAVEAIAALEQRLDGSDERHLAAARISEAYSARHWADAALHLLETGRSAISKSRPLSRSPVLEPFPGLALIAPEATLAAARRWCGEADPEVSVVIINWNAGGLTMSCIRQIWAVTRDVRYEIVIADNGSDPAEFALLKTLGPGVRFVDIGCNRFFGEANNIAVEAARADFVCFLNNDAFVQDGWLTALLEPLRKAPDLGAAGPLFLFPDGTVQEAGGSVDAGGYPVRGARGRRTLPEALTRPRRVDYISAAALLVRKALFVQAGGFDLAFEPVYYEDTDLCFKLRAFGGEILFCPSAVVVHVEGASANGDEAAERRRRQLGDLNRAKFVARWKGYLLRRNGPALDAIRSTLASPPPLAPRRRLPFSRRALVYTAEALTPGGGERYLLTLTERLLQDHEVVLATPHPYSRMRVLSLGAEFGLDLQGVQLLSGPEVAGLSDIDLQITMGNHITPPAPARGRRNIYHCQFPFPRGRSPNPEERAWFAGYDELLVNSQFTRMHCEAAINGHQLPDKPIVVLAPPFTPLDPGSALQSRSRILSVGRFFTGGHSKRQDLLIRAFARLVEDHAFEGELHLAGSSSPTGDNLAYLADLMEAAEGRRIFFHVNASASDLRELYASCGLYWHGTGLGADLVAHPFAAEHFGISVVEAMSAGLVAFALASAGPREIIRSGVDGVLYQDLEDLVEQTLITRSWEEDRFKAVSEAARSRAADFRPEVFVEGFARRLDAFREP